MVTATVLPIRPPPARPQGQGGDEGPASFADALATAAPTDEGSPASAGIASGTTSGAAPAPAKRPQDPAGATGPVDLLALARAAVAGAPPPVQPAAADSGTDAPSSGVAADAVTGQAGGTSAAASGGAATPAVGIVPTPGTSLPPATPAATPLAAAPGSATPATDGSAVTVSAIANAAPATTGAATSVAVVAAAEVAVSPPGAAGTGTVAAPSPKPLKPAPPAAVTRGAATTASAGAASSSAPATGGVPGEGTEAGASSAAGGDVAPDPVAAPVSAAVDATAMAAQADSAMQQIVSALQSLGLGPPAGGKQAAAAAAAATGSASTASATGSVSGAAGGVITLALDPEHLGRVTVTVRMHADAVDIHIAVEKTDTLALLDKDRHVLTTAVEGTGRKADLDLAAGLATPAPASAAPTAPTSSGTLSAGGQALRDSAPGQRGQDDRPARAASQDRRYDEDQAAAGSSAVDRVDGGLYL